MTLGDLDNRFFDKLDGLMTRPRQLVMSGGTSSAATWDNLVSLA